MRMHVTAGLLLALTAFAAPAEGQTYAVDQGSWILGGSASFSSTGGSVNGNEADDRVTHVSFLPSAQYFVAPGLALGGALLFSYQSLGNDESVTAYGLGPAATYYFASGEQSMYPYLGATAQFSWLSDDSDDEPTMRNYRGRAGLLFMLSRAVGLDAALFYERNERESDFIDAESDSFGLALGFSAFVF